MFFVFLFVLIFDQAQPQDGCCIIAKDGFSRKERRKERRICHFSLFPPMHENKRERGEREDLARHETLGQPQRQQQHMRGETRKTVFPNINSEAPFFSSFPAMGGKTRCKNNDDTFVSASVEANQRYLCVCVCACVYVRMYITSSGECAYAFFFLDAFLLSQD